MRPVSTTPRLLIWQCPQKHRKGEHIGCIVRHIAQAIKAAPVRLTVSLLRSILVHKASERELSCAWGMQRVTSELRWIAESLVTCISSLRASPCVCHKRLMARWEVFTLVALVPHLHRPILPCLSSRTHSSQIRCSRQVEEIQPLHQHKDHSYTHDQSANMYVSR